MEALFKDIYSGCMILAAIIMSLIIIAAFFIPVLGILVAFCISEYIVDEHASNWSFQAKEGIHLFAVITQIAISSYVLMHV